MSAPLPSEFAALVPALATTAKGTSNATGAELRKIMLGTGNEDSLAHLMKQWMENWFDNSGAITGDLHDAICALPCVQDADTGPSVPTTSTTTTPGGPTTTTTTSTTTTAAGTTTTTSSTTTAFAPLIRSFSTAEAGDTITWTGLDAGTYVVKWYSGWYEIVTGFGSNKYGTVQGVTDRINPYGGLLSTTYENPTNPNDVTTAKYAGNAFNAGPSRSYTVAQGGSIQLDMQWLQAGTVNNFALSYILSKV